MCIRDSYTWAQKEVEGQIEITCIVKHVQGHYETTSLKAAKDDTGAKNNIQSIGSSVSYLKRYTLANSLGLSVDQDDDAQSVTLTKGEKEDLLYDKLNDLFDKRNELGLIPTKDIKHYQRVIETNEVNSYKKAIAALEKIEIPKQNA